MNDAILERFSEPTRAWFRAAFAAPTAAQTGAWDAVSSGSNALVVAPTGSGKTLAGFLWSLDRLASAEAPVEPGRRLRVLYVSPLKALAADIERNLRGPLAGISSAAQSLGVRPPDVRVTLRTGDTPAEERRRFRRDPPDILITTPESLFLLLTSQAREALVGIDTVIVDEIHALAGSKRGAHLALSLERLDHLTDKPAQRLGLSATVRPTHEVARFLGGTRPVEIVEVPSDKVFDLSVVVPVEDMSELGEHVRDGDNELADSLDGSAAGVEARTSIWPHVEERVLDLVRSHKSTIVFANSRRLAERLCGRLNELAGEEIARAHHGSVSKEQRKVIEDDLKMGRLATVVATSSLELGIDMAAVDLVVQVESPASVASGLQRVGRAGHQVGAVSRGVFFPKYRGDLLECAVVVQRMKQGAIEHLSMPRNALDVLAQQVIAIVSMDETNVDDLERLVRGAAPYRELPRAALEGVLDMLSGRYPSSDFAELRPRLNWDRATNTLTPRPGAQGIAVTSGGTIPDRGLFGVFISGADSTRVGELDEEMVYESRPGDTFVLGSTTWLIEDITPDRVLVSPAPGQPGKMPFWHGDAPGRPMELGRALGAALREFSEAPGSAFDRLRAGGLDELAARNLVAYLNDQREATGVLPDDRTIVVERFRDEVGDWRICIHSPFGARVHAPWSQAIESSLAERLGIEVQCIYTDDGIVVRVPDAEDLPGASALVFEPEDVEELVVDRVGTSALFASRFRECAARSLLLPKRRPGSRTPLWQQRQKSARLLQVASRYRSFPVILETYRECLQDVFDLDALVGLMGSIRRRDVRVVEVDTPVPSPFASSLQFGFVSAFLYEGDAPLAERRAQALSLDRSLLAELMGREELRELIDEDSLTSLELELQRLEGQQKARGPDDLHDLLRRLGDLDGSEAAARSAEPAATTGWLEALVATRRALRVRVAGIERFIAIEDAARYRDAVGTPLPVGVPDAFLEPVPDALLDLVARYARTHGPFVPVDVAGRLGIAPGGIEVALRALEADGRVVEGEFRPGGTGREWIDAEVLRRLRRRSLAAWRKEVEPAAPDVYARFLVEWHDAAGSRRNASGAGGAELLLETIDRLQGAPVPASVLEPQVFGRRLVGYSGTLLDELLASGEVVWSGAGAIGSSDGWIALATAERADLLLPPPDTGEPSADARRVLEALEQHGASFFRQLGSAAELDDDRLLLALWELVWAGCVTNDTFAPVRALVGGSSAVPRRTRRRPSFPSRLGPPKGAGRWSVVASRSTQSTRVAHALAEQLLARHGILTRSALGIERVAGGFAGIYPVLKSMEEAGRCRRGYFVEGLGGAQFALEGAVDRMRGLAGATDERSAVVLAATDPANPYGAALRWPDRPGVEEGGRGHRAGRKAGAVVVLVDGHLVLYVEKGGKTVLSYSEDDALLKPAVEALVLAARDGALGRLSVERADGGSVLDTPLAAMLTDAGFRLTARGLRLRA